MHIDRPPGILKGDTAQELKARAAAMGANAAPVFAQDEVVELRARQYRVVDFDDAGMTLEPVKKPAALALGDFVKVKGFYLRVIQLRASHAVKAEPWGWPRKGGGPPAKGWRQGKASVAVLDDASPTQEELERMAGRVRERYAELERIRTRPSGGLVAATCFASSPEVMKGEPEPENPELEALRRERERLAKALRETGT